MKRTWVYHATRWGALVAGLVLTTAAVWTGPPPPPLLLVTFALLSLAAESGHISLPHAGSVSFGAVVTLPAIVALGPGYAALCGALGQFGIHLRNRRPRETLVFNASQRAVSLVLAGIAWTGVASGRAVPGPAHPVLAPAAVVPAALACVAVYALATHVLVSLFSASRRALPVWAVMVGNASIRFATTTALGSFGLLLAVIVFGIHVLPEDFEYVLLLPTVAGVVFLFYDVHRQTSRQLLRLYSAVTDLVQATDLDRLLGRLADLLERTASPAGLWVALRNGGEQFDVAVSRGLDAPAAQRLAGVVTREVWGPHPAASARLVRIADYAHNLPEALTAGGPVRSILLAPLTAGPDLVGALGMVHPITDYFIPAQDRTVEMLAAQAAFVVNYLRLYRESQHNLAKAGALQTRNAELLRESQRRAHQLALLNRAFMRVATSLAAEEVFAGLVDELHSTLGYPRVALHLLEGDTLRLVADRGYATAHERVPAARGIAGRVARTGKPALVLDVHRDPDYVESHPMVTQAASAPIGSRAGIIGVISVESIEPVLAAVDLELLTTLAGYATLAIENARHYEEARTLATTDGLTGLPNRRMLWEAFERELARSKRYGAPLSVVMVEVDRFKQYNDTHGHLRGDDLLRRIAGVLTKEHRARIDVVARYGGDEFVVLLPQAGKATAAAVAERIRRAVGAEGAPRVTVSLGVATCPEDGQAIEELLRVADRLMYDVKAAGGDAVAAATGAPLTVRRDPTSRSAF